MTVSVTIPFEYTLSPLKLTRGDSNKQSFFGFTFSYWKAKRYMMSVELPLSTKIFLVLNPSIMSMITKGLSRGCFTPHASSFKKTIPGLSLRPSLVLGLTHCMDAIHLSLLCFL